MRPPFLQGHLPPDMYTGSRNEGQAWTEEQFSLTLKMQPGHVSKLWDSFPSLAWRTTVHFVWPSDLLRGGLVFIVF